MEIAKLLDESVFFKGISPVNRGLLAGISRKKVLKKGETLFNEGATGHSLWLLAEGSIRIFKLSPDGKETVIRIAKPGEVFAEVVLFERDSYPATATALVKSEVISIPKDEIHKLFEDKRFRADFMNMLVSKMRFLTNQVQYLTSFDVEQRFFHFLEEQGGRKDSIKLTISKKDIASAIRTTPETFSRLLLRLKKEKVLRWTDDEIIFRQGFWDDWEI